MTPHPRVVHFRFDFWCANKIISRFRRHGPTVFICIVQTWQIMLNIFIRSFSMIISTAKSSFPPKTCHAFTSCINSNFLNDGKMCIRELFLWIWKAQKGREKAVVVSFGLIPPDANRHADNPNLKSSYQSFQWEKRQLLLYIYFIAHQTTLRVCQIIVISCRMSPVSCRPPSHLPSFLCRTLAMLCLLA